MGRKFESDYGQFSQGKMATINRFFHDQGMERGRNNFHNYASLLRPKSVRLLGEVIPSTFLIFQNLIFADPEKLKGNQEHLQHHLFFR